MAYEQKTPEQMDAAADLAEAELAQFALLDGLSIVDIAHWWKRWYMDAGHSRLGRVLLKHAQ